MKLIYFFLGIVAISYSCQRQADLSQGKKYNFDNELKQALILGYFNEVGDDLSLVIHDSTIYYLSNRGKEFSENKFLFHLIRKDNTFLNLDFYKREILVRDSIKGIFRNFNIIKKNFDIKGFIGLRTGQFTRINDKSTSNLWVNQMLFSEIMAGKNVYQNQFTDEIGINLLNEHFLEMLRKDVFFKNSFNFYILLSKKELLIISENDTDLESKFMLHFISANNDFDNYSFYFKNKEFQQFLETPFKKLNIARIKLPEFDNYVKIRIGQFNSNGNIWAQEIWIDEVNTNELLRYNDEFSKLIK
ncbi:hypothetical protein [uncultured Eudoraea sp.]|uniref:hypothetical protein n=1 Tax=uncultured Eudoraea sp. TaxID=1035614 RepID=UPI00261F00C3|nr:hypothetical protein [uncultured Eudoraea sp.]